jgi:hypothetical protein
MNMNSSYEYNNYISDFILINNYQNYNFGVNYGYINLSLLFTAYEIDI